MRRGFSLIELSIVLVIIGLLAGGIMAGQSLIKASKLRAVATEFIRYSTAVHTFRDKYRALPGDMRNATKFWGAQDPNPATCQTTASTSALTCDGNGDGMVTENDETFRFWQHLANAGLIEGTYNGINGPGGTSGGFSQGIPGLNIPKSHFDNAGWYLSYQGNSSGDNWTYAYNYGHVWYFGAADPSGRTQWGILKAEEAWNLDTKLDDGKPGSGSVIARSDPIAFGTSGGCTTSASKTDYTGTYNFNATGTPCAFMIQQ